jgi:hypothetical protein
MLGILSPTFTSISTSCDGSMDCNAVRRSYSGIVGALLDRIVPAIWRSGACNGILPRTFHAGTDESAVFARTRLCEDKEM